MSNHCKNKVSRTAQGTYLMRATSYYETDPCYKSEDFIAAQSMPTAIKFMLKYNILRTVLKKAMFKIPSIYEYVISRTKIIDELFENLTDNIEQVLIFGAGFDSRAIRFNSRLKNAKVFELDAPPTQQVKIHWFTKRKIDFPPNITFISIDFNKESLAEKLEQAGFEKNRRCLFLLEGLTYYLSQEAIDNTFNLIKDHSAQGSLLIFDYVHASNLRNKASIQKYYQALVKVGEEPRFMVTGQIQDFLANYNFDLSEEFDSNQLAKNFFGQTAFAPTGQLFRIVKAHKK